MARVWNGRGMQRATVHPFSVRRTGVRIVAPVKAAACTAIIALALSGCSAPKSFNTVTDHGDDIASLFTLVMILSAFVFLLVVGLIIWILIRFRGGLDEPDPPQVHGNTRLEIFWTATPVLVLAVLFVLMIRTMQRVDATEPDALEIDVIGHTWWWEFRYPGQNVVIANEVHLPVGRPVIFNITSADVVHSFWVPQFGWKIDAVPGKPNYLRLTASDPGRYLGMCAEYCGMQHAWMQIQAVVDPAGDFDAWVAAQRQAPPQPNDAQATRGRDVFLRNTCVSCHTIEGTTANGDVGPNLTHIGSRSVLGAGAIDNTPENMTRFIQDPNALKPGVLMPGFNLNVDDLAALVVYLEGLK